ncbi:MAG: methenyltetrahydromethanopterin cyclohydrolase [Candidatus Wukongarchaeota archaeon]|nr:methenyltetrahydromethanopterin cyclohydrolase [Candidatus Wukongarchaeota archaeon]
MVSVNTQATKLITECMMKDLERINCRATKWSNGATCIDCGVEVPGSLEAGLYMTSVCLGNLARLWITNENYDSLILPTIHVAASHATIATLGSQFAGWSMKLEKYYALGSGPARALSRVEKELYAKIDYADNADSAAIIIEGDKIPPEGIADLVAEKCGISTKNVYVLVAPTSSIAGSVQISGRIVEVGIHKLFHEEYDVKKVFSGSGAAPIAPVHPKSVKAMGRTNDATIYAGTVNLTVNGGLGDNPQELIDKIPSNSSKDYGRPFYDIFKEAEFDFYKIDAGMFAPAMISVTDAESGKTYSAGKINLDILKQSFGVK